jgi:DNA invertase Pin-like site-specific DNA recombinase
MGGLAEFERKLIRQRCDEGIARAKRMSKQFGRPSALDAGQKRVIADRHAKGDTAEQLAQEYEVGVATIWRALRPFEASASV